MQFNFLSFLSLWYWGSVIVGVVCFSYGRKGTIGMCSFSGAVCSNRDKFSVFVFCLGGSPGRVTGLVPHFNRTFVHCGQNTVGASRIVRRCNSVLASCYIGVGSVRGSVARF